MPFEPEKITAQHIRDAVVQIETEKIQLHNSTGYDVIINGKPYPPKEVLRYAHKLAAGEYTWQMSGGAPTNQFLKNLGFGVLPKSNTEKVRYWLYAPGEGARKWDEFYEKGIMALGWEELGDLTQYKNKEEIATKLKESYKGDGDKRNDATCNFDFVYSLKAGDIVIPKRGRKEYLGFGIVKSDYFFDETRDEYKSCRKVDWIKKGSWNETEGAIVLKTLTDITKYPDYVQKLIDLIGINETSKKRQVWFVCQGGSTKTDEWRTYLFAPNKTKNGRTRDHWDNVKKIKKGDIIFNYFKGIKAISVAKEDSHPAINPKPSEEWQNDGNLVNIDCYPLNPTFDRDKLVKLAPQIRDTISSGGPIDRVNSIKQGYLFNFNHESARIVRQAYNQPFPEPVENMLFNEKPIETNSAKNALNSSLNIILYGPPGTGKTYHSIDKAVQIATGSSSTDHKKNKKVFDDLRSQGQIEFVTFHQNYSYEDFMVGLRPDIEFEQLRFKSHKGIFYEIAKRARENYELYVSGANKQRTFEEVFQELLEPLDNGQPVPIEMASRISFEITEVTDTSIKFKKHSGGDQHTLSIATLKDLVSGNRDLPSGLASYYSPLIKRLQQMRTTSEKAEPVKNFVIVIDEINRANISKVFGELITLLEEDKRLAQENELRITLPNGEKDFGLSPNLYVIGTMNTADKSIALIDIALRRRFEFIGFYPQYDLLDTGAASLLRHLNSAVYDRKKSADYLVGHAYFMRNQPLESVLKNKVIPLLMEYFSGNTKIVSEIFDGSGWNVEYDLLSYNWNISKS